MIIYTNFMGNTDTKRTVDDTILDEDAMRRYFRKPDYSILGICGKRLVKFVQKPKKTNTTIYVFNIAAFFDDEHGYLSHLTTWFSLYHMTDTKYRNLYEEFVKEGEEPVSAVKRVMRKIEEEVGRQEEYELWRKIDKNVRSAPGFIKIVLAIVMGGIVGILGGAIIGTFIKSLFNEATICGAVVGIVISIIVSEHYKNKIENVKKKILENYNKTMQEIGMNIILDDEEIEKVIEKLKNNNVIVMKIDESDSQKNEGASVELKYFKDLDNAPLLEEKDIKLIQEIKFFKKFYKGFQFKNDSSQPCIDDREDQREFCEKKKELLKELEKLKNSN